MTTLHLPKRPDRHHDRRDIDHRACSNLSRRNPCTETLAPVHAVAGRRSRGPPRRSEWLQTERELQRLSLDRQQFLRQPPNPIQGRPQHFPIQQRQGVEESESGHVVVVNHGDSEKSVSVAKESEIVFDQIFGCLLDSFDFLDGHPTYCDHLGDRALNDRGI